VAACRPWLEAELESVRPKIVVCLGATAAQAVLGKPVSITKERGKFIDSSSGLLTFITSTLLRFTVSARKTSKRKSIDVLLPKLNKSNVSFKV
jgi:uracil-DNA glycosylase